MQDFKNAFMQFDGRDKLTNSFSVLYFPFHGLRFTVTIIHFKDLLLFLPNFPPVLPLSPVIRSRP